MEVGYSLRWFSAQPPHHHIPRQPRVPALPLDPYQILDDAVLEALLARRGVEELHRPLDAVDLEGRRLRIAEAVSELVSKGEPGGLGELHRPQAGAEEVAVGVDDFDVRHGSRSAFRCC